MHCGNAWSSCAGLNAVQLDNALVPQGAARIGFISQGQKQKRPRAFSGARLQLPAYENHTELKYFHDLLQNYSHVSEVPIKNAWHVLMSEGKKTCTK